MPEAGETAKYPAALAALADFGGPMDNFAKMTLSGDHNNSTTSIVVNESIPATWPQAGWLTCESEIMRYTSYNAGTKTFTVAARDGGNANAQGTAAAPHTSGTRIGRYLTEQWFNQLEAEVIAMQTAMGINFSGQTPQMPNLVLNSDFGRRTVLGLAMPEVFADTSGYAVVSGAPTVSANILTQNAASNVIEWPKDQSRSWAWRDARSSATFKMVSTTGVYELRVRFVDGNNYVYCRFDGAGNFQLRKVIGGTDTQVATVAQAGTLNNWYWFEVEAQGTAFIAKMYNTGGTASGVTKTASTLLQTISGTIADAAVAVGSLSISSNPTNTQWGGIPASPGGVYVETWLPESYAISFTGTLGGQAICYDESADSGPISKQWALRVYVPATSRTMNIIQNTPDGSVAPSTPYAGSVYMKVSGLGGSGTLIEVDISSQTSALGLETVIAGLVDAGATSWTRKTATATVSANSRRGQVKVLINNSATATGTAYFLLPQLEQGSVVTAWRNAPADDGGLQAQVQVVAGTDVTTTSTSYVEADSRSLAGNFFLPWDANVTITLAASLKNSGAGNAMYATVTVDGTAIGPGSVAHSPVAAYLVNMGFTIRSSLAAGKHRIAVVWKVGAGTGTFDLSDAATLIVTAYRGK